MHFRLLFIPCLLVLLAGCAGPSANTHESVRPHSNLEPEITELDALKNSRGRPLTQAERQALESKAGISFHLTPEDTREEQLFLQYFTSEKHDTVQRWMLRSEPHLEYVRAVLASHRLPQDLLALPYIESGYNTMAVSSSGAVGMWQFMPATARRFGLTVDWWLDERRDPYLSTVAAARYLKALYGQFGDWQLALAAYNAGEGSISRAMTSTGKQSFKSLADSSAMRDETKHYVPKFLAMLKITKNARRLGFEAPDMQASKDLAEVRVPGGTDLAGLAGYLGLSWDQFHALNPAFRRQESPPDRTTACWVPKRLSEPAMAFCEHPEKRGAEGTRLARNGDTWWKLSRETGIPANVLCEANKGQAKPVPGQPLLVPVAACALDEGGGYVPGPVKGMALAQARGAQAQKASGQGFAPEPAPASYRGSQAAAAVQPASMQPALYLVRHGDTLESVAGRTGVSLQELIGLNKADPRQPLTPGTPLLIPARGQAREPAPQSVQTAQAQPVREVQARPERHYPAQPAHEVRPAAPVEQAQAQPEPDVQSYRKVQPYRAVRAQERAEAVQEAREQAEPPRVAQAEPDASAYRKIQPYRKVKAQAEPEQAAQAPPIREVQVDTPDDKTELNPAPKYRIIHRSGT